MAQFITYGNFKAKILRDCDLEQEQFITPDELIGLTNSAIDDAEAIIHGIYEDYFLKSTTIATVDGQSDYELPSDIYGDKLRHVLFSNGTETRYKVRRETNFVQTLEAQSTDALKYIIINSSASSKVMRFFPTPTGVNVGTLTIYYLRNATRIDDTQDDATIDATIMDIPEFQNYLYEHVKLGVAKKEKLGQDLQVEATALQAQAQLMIDTLTSRVPDEDTEVTKDLTAYYDFYDNDWPPYYPV